MPITENTRADRALVASEQRYQSLLDATTSYVYKVTLEGGYSVATTHNPGCEAITGYLSRDFDSDHLLWHRMIPGEDRQGVLDHVERILRGEIPKPLEHRIVRKDGSIRWIRNVPVPQSDAEGRLLSYSGLITDITERRRAEQLLSLQYSVTRELAESGTIPEAMTRILEAICGTFPWDWGVFWIFDPKAVRLRWGEIWHASSDRLKPFEVVSRALTFQRGVDLPGRVWASGEPAWLADVVQDGNFSRASIAGKIGLHQACALPVYQGIHLAGVIELCGREIQSPDLHMLRTLITVGAQIRQYLERKSAQDELTTEHNLRCALIDSLPDYIYGKDTKSRFVMNNVAHARVLGMAHPREALGKTDQDIFPAELAGRYRADDESVLLSGEPLLNREEPVVDRQGNQRWILTSKVPWKDSEGKIVGLIGVSRDISERKHAEERLRQTCEELANREESLKRALQELQASHEKLKTTELQLMQAAKLEAVGTLAAGIAHEVKNPLQTILLGLDYLTQALPADREEITLALSDMRNAVQRANAIIREVLHFSAASAFESRAEDPNALVERSLWLINNELIASQTTVVRHLAAGLPMVRMDHGKMEQVFLNLVLNALQAMSQGGTLTVTTRATQIGEGQALSERILHPFQPGDTVVAIEVEDTGTGIPESKLPKVFDPFFTTKPAGSGTGLGLSVIRKIVDLHGGAIGIENVPRGGARATVLLKAGQETTPITRKRILIVDDEISFTRLLKLNLERTQEYTVRVENCSSAALATAEDFLPDLILLDRIMPDLDGDELVLCLRASSQLKGIRIVLLTAAATTAEITPRDGRANRPPLLAKPVDRFEVLDCLEKHLGG